MSFIAWLDTSPEQQKRMREIVRLVEDTETIDELGIGQIRDTFSNLLFHGTSVLLTRRAITSSCRGHSSWWRSGRRRILPPFSAPPRTTSDRCEAIRKSGELEGLIGRRRVASNRLQGATPTAIVEFVGIEHRITYPASQPFTVEDDQ